MTVSRRQMTRSKPLMNKPTQSLGHLHLREAQTSNVPRSRAGWSGASSVDQPWRPCSKEPLHRYILAMLGHPRKTRDLQRVRLDFATSCPRANDPDQPRGSFAWRQGPLKANRQPLAWEPA
eukprot:5180983-Amphidinium_carterae.1